MMLSLDGWAKVHVRRVYGGSAGWSVDEARTVEDELRGDLALLKLQGSWYGLMSSNRCRVNVARPGCTCD